MVTFRNSMSVTRREKTAYTTKAMKNSNRYTKPQSQTVKYLKTQHIKFSNRD